MKTHDVQTHEGDVHTTLSILYEIFSDLHPRNFTIRLWDGTTWEPEDGQDARLTMVLQHPGALRKMLMHPNELTLSEAYIYNDFDIEAAYDTAVIFTDEATYRTWRLNHAGAALGFKNGKNSLYQTLLVKPLKGDSMQPLTRADLYA